MSRRLLIPVATATLLVAGLGACSTGTRGVVDVQAGDVAETLTAQPDVTVLDVRTPAEFAAGHLPGAVNVDVQVGSFAEQIDELAKDGTYLVYCQSGNRSGVATDAMVDAGFTDVLDMQGGVVAWQRAGGRLVTDGS